MEEKELTKEQKDKIIKYKKIRLICIVFCVVLYLIGLVLLIKALNTDLPIMGEEGWFDESFRQNGQIFGSVAILMVTTFILFVSMGATTSAIYSVKHADQLKQLQNANASQIKNAFYNAFNLKEAKKKKECEYCGATMDDEEDVCPACGSRAFKDS